MWRNREKKTVVKDEKKRWNVDLGLNKSLVTKQLMQVHSHQGVLRSAHIHNEHDQFRDIRHLSTVCVSVCVCVQRGI